MVLDSFRAMFRLMELAEAEKEKKPCVEAMSDQELDSFIMEYVRRAMHERRDQDEAAGL